MNLRKTTTPDAWLDRQISQLGEYKDIDELCKLFISSQKFIISFKNTLESTTKSSNKKINDVNYDLNWELRLSKLIYSEIKKSPPLPVLPPLAPLIKISGIVEEIKFRKAMACFDSTIYSTVQTELDMKRQSDNIGASIAMIAQTMSDTTPHALFNDGGLNKKKCFYIEGKVGGKNFSGWFGMSNIRIGDYVEMSVMPDGDNNLAYAILTPELRTVSFTPKCNRDGKSMTLPLSILGVFILLSFIFLPLLIFTSGASVGLLLCYILSSSLLGFCVYKSDKRKNGPSYELFERIIESLGTINPKDLTNAYRKKKKENNWTIRNEQDRPMPQIKTEYSDEYFYYY